MLTFKKEMLCNEICKGRLKCEHLHVVCTVINLSILTHYFNNCLFVNRKTFITYVQVPLLTSDRVLFYRVLSFEIS